MHERLVLISGRAHRELAAEIAAYLGLGLGAVAEAGGWGWG